MHVNTIYYSSDIATYFSNTVILVSFAETRYSVSEGSVVDVCVYIMSGILPPNGFVDFTVSTISTTATSKFAALRITVHYLSLYYISFSLLFVLFVVNQ